MDSARALTGARCGVIATVDEAGQPQDFVSSGLSPQEHRQLAEWPDGHRLFEHLRNLPGALRLSDLNGYVRSLGFSSKPLPTKTFKTFQARVPRCGIGRWRSATSSSAARRGEATSRRKTKRSCCCSPRRRPRRIANARTHRDEQRARADLEALIDTSPVGVVVFEARTGRPVSVNREAKRIVEGLRQPGRSLEEMLEVTICRRADGREVALDGRSMGQLLRSAETVRAEE